MRSSLWTLLLCIGVGFATLAATRSVEADRSGVDERPPAAAVCEADPAEVSGDAMCGKCGDGYCNPRCGETSASCPRDCGIASPSAAEAMCGKCGDNYCNPRCGETATSCPRDCAATAW